MLCCYLLNICVFDLMEAWVRGCWSENLASNICTYTLTAGKKQNLIVDKSCVS